MYLTRMYLNPVRRGARKLLGSPQTMHAAVLAGFPPNDPVHQPGEGRILWRVDHRPDRTTTLYLVSPSEPDLNHLVEQAGWQTCERWLTKSYNPLLDKLQQGQRWAFRLTANPVHSGRKADDSPDTQRFAMVTVRQQTDWLLKRTGRHGFSVAAQTNNEPNLIVHQRQTRVFARRPGQKSVTIGMATYDGILDVEDADLLRNALVSGIGHAKAYGCGLLTLANPE